MCLEALKPLMVIIAQNLASVLDFPVFLNDNSLFRGAVRVMEEVWR